MKKYNYKNVDKTLKTFDREFADKEIRPGVRSFDNQFVNTNIDNSLRSFDKSSMDSLKKLKKNNPFYK